MPTQIILIQLDSESIGFGNVYRSSKVKPDDLSTPLGMIMLCSKNHQEVMEKSPLLLNETEHEIDLGCYKGPSGEGFSGWQQVLDPTYHQRPLEDRVAVAKCLMRGSINGYDVVRRALSLDSVSPQTHNLRSIDRDFLNHIAAYLKGLPVECRNMSDTKEALNGTSSGDVFFCA